MFYRIFTVCIAVGLAAIALPVRASTLVEAQPLTDEIIVLTFRDGEAVRETLGHGHDGKIVSDPLDTRRAMLNSSYTVSSDDDPEFADGIKPIMVGRKAKGTAFARVAQWKLGHVLTHWIYLVLDRPMTSGKSYNVDAGILAGDGVAVSLLFDEMETRSEAVQVNQIGFVPATPQKYAYLSHWMGTLGGLKLDAYSESVFTVIDVSSGKAVLRGDLKRRRRAGAADDAYESDHTRADIWELDFSALRTPGEYFIAVDGIGRSFPFKIGKDVYREAFRVTTRGLYHQRCGIELDNRYTKWPRPRCHHPDDRDIYQSTHPKMVKGNAFTELPATATEEKVHYWGGYHDAGDWDRGAQHLTVSDCLLLVYELAPDKFSDSELSIPESGNGVPDIVDEARFNLDCYKRMQKPHGGVCGGLESAGHPKFGEAAWTDTLPLFAYAPDPDASLRYAATACRMHRVLDRVGRKEDARQYLDTAARAWTWALQNGGDSDKLRDLRVYAAAELFKSTGQPQYHASFKAGLKISSPTTELSIWQQHDQRWAAWTYATTDRAEVDSELRERVRAAVRHYARTDVIDTGARRGRRNGYHWWKPFGHTSATTPSNLPLIVAHAVSGEQKFLTQMYLNCDNTLGANPLNICWVTGLGDRPVRTILHHDSQYDTFDEPVPGLVPYGPLRDKGKDKLNWTHAWGQNTAFPSAAKWPSDELWFGNYMSPAAAEFTVTESIGPAAAAYGYLCAGSEK